MKTCVKLCNTKLILGLAWLSLHFTVQASHPEQSDKTLAPYFTVVGEGSKLPLKSTRAKAEVAGVIANVQVNQVYGNEGPKPIEAVYVFPASTRAAVHGLRMKVGGRVVVAKVERREEAKQQFETAKSEGKSATLLEQQRPNVFEMRVANILPGEQIEVELDYTEVLVPRDGVYEFVYPAVVGPRYSNVSEADAKETDRWVKTPYLLPEDAAGIPVTTPSTSSDSSQPGTTTPYTFDINVHLVTGVPFHDLNSPSHAVQVIQDDQRAEVRLAEAEHTTGGNRDFILRYRLCGDAVESGLLLAKGEHENFFLLMIQPPQRVKPEQIPPREYIFIVDVSGSMHGFPLKTVRKICKELFQGLRPQDRFNVLFFSGGSTLLAPASLPATQANVQKAIHLLEKAEGGGGTELLSALKRALALPREAGIARSVVVMTDGYVTVEPEAFELVRNHLGEANLFSFGIGSSVNRFLIEGLARAGLGEPFVVTGEKEAKAEAKRFLEYVSAPLLTGVRIDYQGLDVRDVEPASIPDLFSEKPIVVFGKWNGQGTIRVRGLSGSTVYETEIQTKDQPLQPLQALPYLWARHRIQRLSDDNNLKANDARVEEVAQLGLTYNLLTAYTSFIAVDEVQRSEGGQVETVKQPLPLPAGVSIHAVGPAPGVSQVPEPSTWMLMLVGLVAFWYWGARRKRHTA